ncbi:N-carbamoylputrescine amidase [bacterium]|nr:N-carbamoylputrescine amidase [bacterium]
MKIAGIQCAFSDNEVENLNNLEVYVREAAALGARVVLAPELFQGYYFCQHVNKENFSRAKSVEESESIKRFLDLSKELKLFLPVSFFEKSPQGYFNSLAVIDSGKLIDVYRKSHIPEGSGYEEREYFKEGDTGFKVYEVDGVQVGIGICWDQWFPELARCLRLKGAHVILYPTAIGSEPADGSMDTSEMWRKVMLGHSVANSVGVVASNRIGKEDEITFYGTSFIANQKGEVLVEKSRTQEGVFCVDLDVEAIKRHQKNWPFLKHRRPELYGDLVKARE